MSNQEQQATTILSVKELGAFMAIQRYELRLTQNQVAELAGISIRSLKQIEAGQANPGMQQILRILYVLGLQLTLDKRLIK